MTRFNYMIVFIVVVKQVQSLRDYVVVGTKPFYPVDYFLPENCNKCHNAATGHTCEPIAKGQKYKHVTVGGSCSSHNIVVSNLNLLQCKWSLLSNWL